MIHKFKFWLNEIESEIFEYEEDENTSYVDIVEQMEADRLEWIFNNIDTGYEKI
jgi:hypothetical protein